MFTKTVTRWLYVRFSFLVLVSLLVSNLSTAPIAYAQTTDTTTPTIVPTQSSTDTGTPAATATSVETTDTPSLPAPTNTVASTQVPATPIDLTATPSDTTTPSETSTEVDIPTLTETPIEPPTSIPTFTETPQIAQTATPTVTETPTDTPTIMPTASGSNVVVASSTVPNDDRANATVIGSLPYTNSISTAGATMESGEQLSTCNSASDGASVWYKFIPTATGIYSVDTQGSNYDTVAAIYSGSANLSQVNCNNDDPGPYPSPSYSRLDFTGTKGTTYYIQITNYNNNSNLSDSLTLHVLKIPCASTSLCITVRDQQPEGATYPEALVGYYIGIGDAYGFIEIKSIKSGKYTVFTGGDSSAVVTENVSAPGLFDSNAVGLPGTKIITKDINGNNINCSIFLTDSTGRTVGAGYTSSSGDPEEIYVSPGTYHVSAIGWNNLYYIALKNQQFSNTDGNTILMDSSAMIHETLTYHWDGLSDTESDLDMAYSSTSSFLFDLNDGDVVTIATPPDMEFPLDAYADNTDSSNNQWNYSFFSGNYKTAQNGRNTVLKYGGSPFTISLDAGHVPYVPNETGTLNQTSYDAYGNQVTQDYYISGSSSQALSSGTPKMIITDPNKPSKFFVSRPVKGSQRPTAEAVSSQSSYNPIYPTYTVHDSIGNLVAGYYPYWIYFQMPYYFKITNTAPLGSWRGDVSVDFGPHGGVQTAPPIHFDVIAPPPGDSRAGAIPVTLAGNTFDKTINTVGATLESGEPTSTCGQNNDSTVWFKFTPSATGNFEVATLGSDYDTVLTVFKSSTGGQINCNDNDNGQQNVAQSKLKFTGIKGTTYYIQVASRDSGTGGNLTFHMEQIQCPTNKFCVTVTDHNSQASWWPSVAALNSQGWWVSGNSGDEYGYTEVGSIPSAKYTLITSAWEVMIVNKNIAGPGVFSATAAGLPRVKISALDKNGQPLQLDDIALVPDFPTGMWGWVGQTINDTSRTVYLSPGSYSVVGLSYGSHYILGQGKKAFTTAAGQSVSLDASKMAIDALTFHFNGIGTNTTYFYAAIPFGAENYNDGRFMPLHDGDSMLVGLPAGTSVPIRATFNWNDTSGDNWGYFLESGNPYTAGSGAASYTFGGTLSMQLDSADGEYSPGDYGYVYKLVRDGYNNKLINLQEQLSGSQDSAEVPATYAIQRDDNSAVDGSNSDDTYLRHYRFTVPTSEPTGKWHASVSLNTGPYQGTLTAINVFPIVGAKPAPTSNDDFNDAILIDANPFASEIDTYGTTLAKDDPQSSSCYINQSGASVWYKYVSPSDGILSLDTIGSNYDTVLAVWTGKRGKLSLVACNDNRSTIPIDRTSELTMNASKGITYYVEILGYSVNPYTTSTSLSTQTTTTGGGVTAQGAGGQLQFHAGFTACWKITAGINLPGSGSVIIQPASNCWNGGYTDGTAVTLQAQANTNFAFMQWTGTTTGTNPNLNLTIHQDQLLTANFRDTIPPYVTLLNTNAPTADKKLSPGETTNVAIKQFLVTFSKPMTYLSNTAANSVTNPANYNLVEAGPDTVFGDSDDTIIPINLVMYTPATKIVTVNLNGGVPLPSGRYTFTILHTVEDLSINQLDGNHDGTGGDDFSLAFNVNILPPAPVLLSPATKLATNNPTPGFSWQATAQALKYHIQISGKSTFSPITQEPNLADGVLNYTATTLVDGVYYWRVAGINTFGAQGLWSQARTFTIDTTPPPAPILKAPADAVTVSGTPIFSWNSAATATAYQLQYNLTDDFSSPAYSSAWISITQLTPPWFDGSYYWRVCARDSVGNTAESSCSTSRSITILPLTPVAPKLKAPAVGAKTSNIPTLSWNSTVYGTAYEVQINPTSNFTTPEYDVSLGSVLSYTPNNPLASGKYYWRVRVSNDKSVAGAWSSAWYFIVP
ncbi:MAG: hypothetical protein P4L50_29140 [Anaerolineaceae bacterium]|nr:hypothetical protein [Anaerolineaceae bacterium]